MTGNYFYNLIVTELKCLKSHTTSRAGLIQKQNIKHININMFLLLCRYELKEKAKLHNCFTK